MSKPSTTEPRHTAPAQPVAEARTGPGVAEVAAVVELLDADRPLAEVLAACAALVPGWLGSAAVVGLLDDDVVVAAPEGSPAQHLCTDDRWWRPTTVDGHRRTPGDFAGFPDDLAEAASVDGFSTAWALPLQDRTSQQPVGCLMLWVQATADTTSVPDTLLCLACRLAGYAIREERRRRDLWFASVTDPLTGLGNRRALRRHLAGATGPVTVAMVDLDEFKPVNDTHGHATGDEVLQVVAERLTRSVRAGDLVVRLGGDEFVVVLADGTDPATLADRVVDAVETPIHIDGAPPLTVGVSVGIASAPAELAVRQADRELYRAKQATTRPRVSIR